MTIIDTTEHVEPFPTGWVDPADQILSDEETTPIHVEPLEPIMYRTSRNRVFKWGIWWLVAAANLEPIFKAHGFPTSMRVHDTFEQALDTVRLELAKAAA